MNGKIPLIARNVKRMYAGFFITAVVFFILCSYLTKFNPMVLITNGDAFWEFITEDFLPPTLPKSSRIPGIFSSILVTLALAMSSTTTAALLAFFVSLFGSEKVSPFPKAAKAVRGFATFLRNIPALVRAFVETIVGMVGGGGVGLTLFSYIKSFRYDIALTIILLIAAMVIVVDQITNRLRKELLK